MSEGPESFSFTPTPERNEMWKESVEVVNVLEQHGLPHRQEIEGEEITAETCVDVDDRALREEDCVSVVYGQPHAGEYVPKDIWDRTTDVGKDTLVMIDRATGEIFSSEIVPSVGTKACRFVVDPNRAPLPSQETNKPGSVLWTEAIGGGSVYKEGQEPTGEEITELAERFYIPYYNRMMSVVGALADRRQADDERVLVIDGHSFPISNAPGMQRYWKEQYGVDDPTELPMFNIGSADGVSCDADIVEAFEDALRKNVEALPEEERALITSVLKGDVVAVDYPFKGVHNVDFWSTREEGINAIQLEVNEALYMYEPGNEYMQGNYDEEKIAIVKKIIEQSVRDVDAVLKGRQV